MPTPREIVTFSDDDAPEDASPWVDGVEPERVLEIVEPDPGWAEVFARTESVLRSTLGAGVLAVEHVGSTSVPGLPAKPIVDVDLTIADPGDEDAYVPALVREGFVLLLREPWWYGHRMLRGPGAPTNVHVWGPDCPETVRHRMFRDWLREHPPDRDLYRDTKLAAAREANAAGEHVVQYNARKQAVIREIYGRVFVAAGLV